MTTFKDALIQLHPHDLIAIAKTTLQPGTAIQCQNGDILLIQDLIPSGHKVAPCDLEAGQTVSRYGYPIGETRQAIPAGSWVHTHNLALAAQTQTYQWTVVAPRQPQPSGQTFLGYARPQGKAGTRNYIAVIATVTCSTQVSAQIARAFPAATLRAYPNVAGVIPILHGSGCALPPGGLSHTYLKRTLANIARNPNIAAAVYVSLGCELMQLEACQPVFAPQEIDPQGLIIQEQGGFEKTVAAGIAAVQALLPQVNQIERTPQPLSDLTVALQCGGSDGWSGVTANPLIGRVVDRLVTAGGSAVLAETPEIYGAEQLLLHRVTSPQVGQDLIDRCQWWSAEAAARGFSLDNNPAPGNKKGGLTTIFEKSLGAVAKAGSTPLNGVYAYAQWIDQPGLVFMDTPGYDPISITGQLAGGCNLILFSTGRGSVYGSAIAPCIKIASQSRLFNQMGADMDFNAGQLLEGVSWQSARQELFDLLVATASGRRTASESHGLVENEFVPWQPDAVL